MFELTGKVAVVTGSTKGIGRAMVQGLAEAGASVVVSSRKQDLCDEVAEEIAAARAAGTPLVLVSFGYTEVPAWELRPDRLIDHFDELLPACLELLAPA